MTIAGTWAGVALASVFLKSLSLNDCLAVGSGFGYYSLSSILITQYKGVELGTIALLANIFREIITFAFCAAYGEIFREIRSYFGGWSHYHGYNFSHYYTFFR